MRQTSRRKLGLRSCITAEFRGNGNWLGTFAIYLPYRGGNEQSRLHVAEPARHAKTSRQAKGSPKRVPRSHEVVVRRLSNGGGRSRGNFCSAFPADSRKMITRLKYENENVQG
jgi:hypothetical protein